MERRRSPRVAAKERVTVTELGPDRQAHVGLIVENSENSLTMKLVTAIACGTPVEVETTNIRMLGEVLRCEPANEGFRIALEFRHSLKDLQALEMFNKALVGKRTKQEILPPIHIMRE
jgi:hypothetical protein